MEPGGCGLENERTAVRFPAKANKPVRIRGSTNLLFKGYRGCFPWGKAAVA
jgi:hypothetical protein